MAKSSDQWSEGLQQATRETLKEFAFATHADFVCFKHIKSGFGTIAVDDILCGNLRMTDRKTGLEVTFRNAEELICAGWTID